MKGHVYRRGKSWSYLFDIEPDPLTGKRRQANGSGFKTEREAWKACRDAISEYERGQIVTKTKRKVAVALEEWLSRIEHSIKPSMARNWRNYAAYYVNPYIGDRDVWDISGEVCDALYKKLLAEGASKRSRRPGQPRDQCIRDGLQLMGMCFLAARTGMTARDAMAGTPRMIPPSASRSG
jgi:Arm DNA-binding domain